MAGHRAPAGRARPPGRASAAARRLMAAGRHARGAVTDPHTLVGAYVMDAVTADDRAGFEHHLAGCESCQGEVRGLREATGRLAAAAEVRPRAGLREQTMQAAGLIRQLPPVTSDRPAAGDRGNLPGGGGRGCPGWRSAWPPCSRCWPSAWGPR